jgi:hypothetical protein
MIAVQFTANSAANSTDNGPAAVCCSVLRPYHSGRRTAGLSFRCRYSGSGLAAAQAALAAA